MKYFKFILINIIFSLSTASTSVLATNKAAGDVNYRITNAPISSVNFNTTLAYPQANCISIPTHRIELEALSPLGLNNSPVVDYLSTELEGAEYELKLSAKKNFLVLIERVNGTITVFSINAEKIEILDTLSPQQTDFIIGDAEFIDVAFSLDEQYMFGYQNDSQILIWDTANWLIQEIHCRND